MASIPIETLPIIDISEVNSNREAHLDKLRYAAHHVGFFYLVGHQVPQNLIDEFVHVSRTFFALPEQKKLAISNINSAQFRGYTRIGTEVTKGKVDNREQVDIGPEEEYVNDGGHEPVWRRLLGPNLWPQAVPDFRNIALRYQAELIRCARHLLRSLALILEQNENFFDEWFDDAKNPYIFIRPIHYPSQYSEEEHQGVGLHKDYGFITLLYQPDEDIGGLEVVTDKGNYIDVKPIHGAFVVNIGELLEIVSNGYFLATQHRVRSPPMGRDRLSLALFLNPGLDAIIRPLKLSANLARAARGISQESKNPYFAVFGEKELHGKLRSHPETANRFWADVLRQRGPPGVESTL